MTLEGIQLKRFGADVPLPDGVSVQGPNPGVDPAGGCGFYRHEGRVWFFGGLYVPAMKMADGALLTMPEGYEPADVEDASSHMYAYRDDQVREGRAYCQVSNNVLFLDGATWDTAKARYVNLSFSFLHA